LYNDLDINQSIEVKLQDTKKAFLDGWGKNTAFVYEGKSNEIELNDVEVNYWEDESSDYLLPVYKYTGMDNNGEPFICYINACMP
jgi:hypothetical protein